MSSFQKHGNLSFLNQDSSIDYCISSSQNGNCDSSKSTTKIESNEDLMLNLDDIIARLKEQEKLLSSSNLLLEELEIAEICCRAREVLLNQPALLELKAPINIVGDIHGQFNNLLEYFKMTGYPPQTNYLFLGDYVDRGKHSVETLTLLLTYKLRYPENIFLLRGNHECASLNRIYGFYDECKRKYSIKLWRAFVDCYNCLPVAAVIEDNIFCSHGGLSPSLFNLDQIRLIERPCDIPDHGLMCDLLWSDPKNDAVGWSLSDRGVSYTFGSDIVGMFLKRHQFSLVCRAHQVVEDGYEFFANRKLVTIFSAPNYCGEFDNAGAMMCVDKNLVCSFRIQKPQAVKPFKSVSMTNFYKTSNSFM